MQHLEVRPKLRRRLFSDGGFMNVKGHIPGRQRHRARRGLEGDQGRGQEFGIPMKHDDWRELRQGRPELTRVLPATLLPFGSSAWTPGVKADEGACPEGSALWPRLRSMSKLVSALQRVLLPSHSLCLDAGTCRALRRLSDHELEDLVCSRGLLG